MRMPRPSRRKGRASEAALAVGASASSLLRFLAPSISTAARRHRSCAASASWQRLARRAKSTFPSCSSPRSSPFRASLPQFIPRRAPLATAERSADGCVANSETAIGSPPARRTRTRSRDVGDAPLAVPSSPSSTTATAIATATSIMSNAPKTYKAAVITKAGGKFEIQDVRLVVLAPASTSRLPACRPRRRTLMPSCAPYRSSIRSRRRARSSSRVRPTSPLLDPPPRLPLTLWLARSPRFGRLPLGAYSTLSSALFRTVDGPAALLQRPASYRRRPAALLQRPAERRNPRLTFSSPPAGLGRRRPALPYGPPSLSRS